MTLDGFYLKHTHVTRSLKKFILEQSTSFSPDIFESFLDLLHDELEKALSLLMSVPAGVERARKLHQLVETEMAAENQIAVSCFKGCSHCCHMEVEITNFEATILQDLILAKSSDELAQLRPRLQRQSMKTLQDLTWKNPLLKSENRCVFLGSDGACQIYESRPVMCRRHSVTSSPKHCETLDQMITLRYFPRVDLLISAANEDPNLQIGPLAKMLEAGLKSFKD